MNLLAGFADRFVQLVVPRTTAAAVVVQFCYCAKPNPFERKNYYRPCEWVGQPGAGGYLKCGNCFNSGIDC
ncbi:hypothetical protein [Nonomuraea sp. NPDC050643]|uniref:hypothetical protein n=1 Tax=Nonomuraea sp. NPDC050643 TaxID=3155660 RepID=UPI0034067AF9